MSTQLALELSSSSPSNAVYINARCMLQTEEDQRVVVVGGLPVYHYCAADTVAETYAMVMLVESGFAQQTEVARASIGLAFPGTPTHRSTASPEAQAPERTKTGHFQKGLCQEV
jgi:hypothetical protein